MAFIRVLPFLLALAFMALAVFFYSSNNQLTADIEATRAELATAIASNDSLTKTIAFLTDMSKDTEAIINETAQATNSTRQAVAAMRDELSAMKESNNAIKEYLSGVLPDDVRRMLNKPESGSKD